MTNDLSPSKRRTPRLSRQSSHTSLNVGLPPPLPSSPSLDMTIESSASSRSLRTAGRSPRKTPRIRRGDVSSSATSGDEPETASDSDSDLAGGMLLVPTSMVKASPTVPMDMDKETTPRRKVAMPIEPMTVGRGAKKRETLQERLANAARLKKSQSHGDGFHTSGSVGELSLMSVTQAVVKGGAEGQAAKDKVVVCVRIKPTSSPFMHSAYELNSTSLALSDRHPNVVKRGGKVGREAEYTYPVDMLLRQPSKTPELYASKIAPLVEKAMNGFNSTIFAYGQTGSGKSFTMTGTSGELGIIPCAVDGVFDAITADRDRAFLLRVSYVEIYNETLRDLLNFDKGQKEVPVIHSGKGKVYVAPLVEEIVATPQDVMKLLSKGNEGRRIGATDWNERSSRSHCVFTVVIESRPRDTGTGGEDGAADEDIRLSRLNLIDLAGSEKAVSDVERRGEGKHINQSLLALREVINKLTEKKRSHIPYRNSKLTHLLENALGGDSNICVICTMSAEEEHVAETLETLKFAGRCSQVETKAQKNVLPSSEKALIRAKDAEIEELKRRLNGLAAGSGAARGAEQADQVAELAGSVADLEERKKRLTVQLAKLNGEILTSELPRLNGLAPLSPAKPKRRRISEFLGHDRPKTPMEHRRAVSGRPPVPLEPIAQPADLFSDRTTSTLRAALAAKDAEIASLRAELLAAQSSASSNTSTMLDSAHQLEITRFELAENIAAKQSSIDTLESTILELRKSREDILIEDQSRLDAVQRKLDMANAELQRVHREATGDLPSDLEREKEAFKQDLAQMGASHELEVGRLRKEMGKLKEQLKDRWSVAEAAVVQRQETQAANLRWEKEVAHSREAVDKYDDLVARSRELEEQVKAGREVRQHADFLEASNAALQAELSRVEAEAKEQAPRISELEALVDELRAERMDAMAKVADMEFDLVSLKEDVEAKGREAERAKGELERRTDQLAQRDVEYELAKGKLGKEVESLKGELQAARDGEEVFKAGMEKLRSDLASREAEAGDANERSRELDELRRAHEAAIEASIALGKELETSRNDVESARSAMQAAEGCASEANGKLAESVAQLEALQRGHAEAEQQRRILEEAKTAVEAQLAEATDRYNAATAELDISRSAMGGHDEMLQRLRADVEVAQTKTKELKESKVALEAEVAILKAEAGTASATRLELEGVKEQLRASQADKEHLQRDIESLQTSTSETDDIVVKLRGEIETAEQKARELASNADGLQAKLEAAEAAAEKEKAAVKENSDELHALRQNLDGDKARMTTRIAELEQSLQSARADCNAAQSAADDARAALKTARQEAETAAAEYVTHSSKLESQATDTKARLEATISERDELRAKYAELEARSNTLQASVDSLRATTAEDDGRLVQLRTDIDDLTRQLEARSIEVNDLTRRIEEEQAAKQAALDEKTQATSDLANIKQQLASAAGALAEVLQLRAALSKAENAVDDSKKNVARLEEQLRSEAAAGEEMSRKLTEAEATVLALQKERDGSRQQLEAQVAVMQASSEELSRAKSERDSLQELIDNAKQSGEEANARVKALQADLNAAVDQRLSANKSIDEAQSARAAAEHALQTADQQCAAAQAELASAKEKMAGLEETIMASEQDDKAARDRYAVLKQQVVRLEAERSAAQTAIEALGKERDAAIKEASEAKSTNSTYTKDLSVAQAEAEAKASALIQAEKQLGVTAKRIAELEKELQQVKNAAAAAAKTAAESATKRRPSLSRKSTLPSIESGDVGTSAGSAVNVMQARHLEEIVHLEAIIDEQQKTIDVQREKIVYWSNELEKQREVVRLLTANPDSPSRSTATLQAAGTKHIKAHSISESPSRLLVGRSGSKENAEPSTSGGAGNESGKKALTGTFTARNLALPSAPTPLPMHTGQYANTTARKLRRVTIDHDMEALHESNKIAQAKAIFDTPEKAARSQVLGNTPKQRRP